MGIAAGFPINSLCELFDAIPRVIDEEIIRSFSYLGEKCVRRIRDRRGQDSWFDQTSNLRSSIGYAIYRDGIKVTESDFAQVKDGAEGSATGRKAVIELATKYSDSTYVLVILAGMEYAVYVEAMEGKDVLASTELWARSEADGYLEKALQRASMRIDKMKQKVGL